MICLASYPRSGNTFLRNVLYEVYGIESAAFPREYEQDDEKSTQDYQVVKTHLRPRNLPVALQDCPSVYLLRDGRDALVSMAHQRKDILEPGTDYYNNLLEAILAQEGSYFGGWSNNVREWAEHADLIIRFSDLIEDPIREAEKLRTLIDLPPPDRSKLPTFKSLKFGDPRYGIAAEEKTFDPKVGYKAFRRGKTSGWKDEMPPELEQLCWRLHGPTLLKWDYEPSNFSSDPRPKKVVIEGSKFYSRDNDGVKRYLVQLIGGLKVLLPYLPEWEIFIYDQKGIEPLLPTQGIATTSPAKPAAKSTFSTYNEEEEILSDRRTMDYEKRLLLFKVVIKKRLPDGVYRRLSDFYRQGPFRKILNRLKLLIRRLKFRKRGDQLVSSLNAADLFHLPLPQHFTEIGTEQAPLLVTVHDLTHRLLPDFHTAENIDLAERGMEAILAKEAHILAVSESTKEDVVTAYKLPTGRVHRVWEAVDTNHFRPQDRVETDDVLLQKYNIPSGPYLLCLSTIEPRKNLRNTLLAFIQLKAEYPDLKTSLVICGKSGWKTEEIFAGIEVERPDIVFTGFVNDDHLPLLYAHAHALCYASFYEGFGLPILEALACKTPAIYGNNSSMPEVAGSGGIAVDPHDVIALKKAMHLLLTDGDLREQKAEAGWRHANKFSWLKTALETLAVYERVIDAEA